MKTTLLVVDDDSAFRRVLAGELQRAGHDVATAATGEEAVRHAAECEPQVVLLDLRLPDATGLEVLQRIREASPATEVIMLTGHGSIDTAIEAIRAGAFDYVAKPCPLDELGVRIERALERQGLRTRTTVLERGLTPPDVASSFVGASEAFRRLVGLIERVAPGDSTVLITGETGAGKEMAARLIHERSPRSVRPFVTVDCAALQENLLLSELFGHERGAFTGADRAKPGLFEVAHRGTIFLDEIGEISPATQVSLLRVLDTNRFRHVGGTREVQVDVRVVAATNRDLSLLVQQGTFREDLYYRLSTIAIALPPLRERQADIPLLVEHFMRLLNARMSCRKRMSPEALQALMTHRWPGNARELRHVIESAMTVSGGDEVRLEHLPISITGQQAPRADDAATGANGRLCSLLEMERAHIEKALRVADGHRGRAAGLLGISERNLYRKLREFGLA